MLFIKINAINTRKIQKSVINLIDIHIKIINMIHQYELILSNNNKMNIKLKLKENKGKILILIKSKIIQIN